MNDDPQPSRSTRSFGSRTPIAIAYLETPPPGVDRWDGGPVPAGCVFWSEAAKGRAFYTLPEDHYNCAVGSYTHNISLPDERAAELDQTLGEMVGAGYLDMAEVPGIPRLSASPAVVAYGPADEVSFVPDVVLVVADANQAMLLYEAALTAGIGAALAPVLGRPSCAVLPLTHNSGSMSMSLGCKGNRIFTQLGNDEMYVCVPGDRWSDLLQGLDRVTSANAAMASRYEAHRDQVGRTG